MKKLYDFVILAESPACGRFPYHEQAHTAQEAVDRARCYLDQHEHIIAVYKQVENWK